MSFYLLELQQVVGRSVVQSSAQHVLQHSQQQGATCHGGESTEHSFALYSIGQHGPTKACIKFMHLLFWGEQFWTRLAVLKRRIRKLSSCTKESCNLAVHLCMAIPKDFASLPTIGVCQIT
jgi:hypothetical protein